MKAELKKAIDLYLERKIPIQKPDGGSVSIGGFGIGASVTGSSLGFSYSGWHPYGIMLKVEEAYQYIKMLEEGRERLKQIVHG